MTRLVSFALTCLISLALIEPVVRPADQTSSLPACCRGEGKHGCAIRKVRRTSGPALAEYCKLWPAPPGAVPATSSSIPVRKVLALVSAPQAELLPAWPGSSVRTFAKKGHFQRGPPVLS